MFFIPEKITHEVLNNSVTKSQTELLGGEKIQHILRTISNYFIYSSAKLWVLGLNSLSNYTQKFLCLSQGRKMDSKR